MTKTYPFDPAEMLDSPEAQADFLSQALATGDLNEVSHALGVVARAHGMTDVARTTGLGRESLYKSLSEGGKPEFGTVLKVMSALGMTLSAQPVTR